MTGIAGESQISVRVTAAALTRQTNKVMTQENVLAEVTNKPRRLWNLSLNDGLRALAFGAIYLTTATQHKRLRMP